MLAGWRLQRGRPCPASEPVSKEVVESTQQLFSSEMLANGLGTTETGVITLYVLEPSTTLEGDVPEAPASLLAAPGHRK